MNTKETTISNMHVIDRLTNAVFSLWNAHGREHTMASLKEMDRLYQEAISCISEVNTDINEQMVLVMELNSKLNRANLDLRLSGTTSKASEIAALLRAPRPTSPVDLLSELPCGGSEEVIPHVYASGCRCKVCKDFA